MTILVHRIHEAPNITYDEFLTRVNRFKVSDVLKVCKALSDWVDQRRASDALISFGPNQFYRATKPAQLYLAPATIAFIAKASLMRSTEVRQSKITDDDLRGLVFMHANLMDAFTLKPNKTIADQHSFLLRIAAEQAPYQGALRRVFPRAWMIFVEANRAIANRPFDVEDEWLKLTGIDLGTFILIGFGYFAGYTQHSSLSRNFTASGIFSDKISEEDCEKFLALASASPEQFRELQAGHAVPDPLYIKSEFNFLWRRPLISIGQELLAPVPVLIAARITNGIRYDLQESMREEKGNPFAEYFGLLFEEYVGRLLKWTFGEDKVHREPKYGKPQKRGPDWVVIDGDTAILIECRTSNLTVETRAIADIDNVRADVRRMFVRTLAKYPGKIEDLKSGLTGLDFTGVEKVYPLIVSYDRIVYEGVYRDLARREFEAEGQEWFEDYELLDVSDFEWLSAWHSKRHIATILDERKARYRVKPTDLGDFLHELAGEGDWPHDHPLHYELQEELLQNAFGAIPGGMPLTTESSRRLATISNTSA